MIAQTQTDRLFCVTERQTEVRFLVDFGAEVRVVPPMLEKHRNRREPPSLHAVNGTAIKAYGRKLLTLDIGFSRTFRWIFIIADARQAIITAEFPWRFVFTVDLRRSMLLDTEAQLSVQVIVSKTNALSPTLPRALADTAWQSSTATFPAVFQPPAPDQKLRHSTTHHIEMKGTLFFARSRRLCIESSPDSQK